MAKLLLSLFKTRPPASFLFALLTLLWGCSEHRDTVLFQHEGPTMGTWFHVTVVLAEHQQPPEAALIDAELERINQLMSTYLDDSELSHFNRAALHTPIPVSDDLCALVLLAREVYRNSDGAFNPAVGPLVDLWGFGPENTHERIPDDAEIAVRMQMIDFESVEPDCAEANGGKTLIRGSPVRLDFSAIAKGYVTDLIGKKLRLLGFTNYLVEVGGEIALSGHNGAGTAWRIAIEKPSLVQSGVQRILALSDVGMATSGDYRNYFEQDGKRYSHTIDPRTGRPIDHNVASVTVIARTSAEADALATALMVLGSEQGMALAERLDLAAYFLVKEGDDFTERFSTRFAAYLSEQGDH